VGGGGAGEAGETLGALWVSPASPALHSVFGIHLNTRHALNFARRQSIEAAAKKSIGRSGVPREGTREWFPRMRPHCPDWPGTLVGIDLSIKQTVSFAQLMKLIRDVFSVDVKRAKTEKYIKPRFE
jgi:hypothetical protein